MPQRAATLPYALRPWLRNCAAVSREFSAYLAARLVVAIVQAMPLDMGDKMCRGLAVLLTGPLTVRLRTTDENLRRVFPAATAADRHRLTVAMWHHLLLMGCEIAWAQRRLHLVNWSRHVRFIGNRIILRAMLSKRPVVGVTGHYGNFEIGGYTMGLMGIHATTIARRLDNRFLHAWVERFRGAKGQHMVDKEGCAPLVKKHLDNGGTLSLLADQHAGSKGCWVNFLGVPASCHKALPLFSLSSGAPMLAGYTRRIGGKPMQFESACTGLADPLNDVHGVCESVHALTCWYNDQLAGAVSLSVEQYWWLHRRWRNPPAKVAQRLARQNHARAAAA